MEYARTEKQDSVASFANVEEIDHGDRCLIDVEMVAVPFSGTASIADPLELLLERASARFAVSNMNKQKHTGL